MYDIYIYVYSYMMVYRLPDLIGAPDRRHHATERAHYVYMYRHNKEAITTIRQESIYNTIYCSSTSYLLFVSRKGTDPSGPG